MKEILFKGKRVDNGKEVVGFYFNVSEHHNPDLSGKRREKEQDNEDNRTYTQRDNAVLKLLSLFQMA